MARCSLQRGLPALATGHSECCREEEGEFFAIDLGGTNLRVLRVTLLKGRGAVVSA